MKKILFILSLSFLFASCSIKQVEGTNRSVFVSGTGTVFVDADKVIIDLAVKTKAKEPAQASAQNSEIMNRVFDAVSAIVPKDNIATKNFRLERERIYKNSNYVDGDYICTNSITVSTQLKDKAGQIVDAALKAGATSLTNFRYTCSDPEMAVKQARTLAVKKCFENANLIAGTSGNKLGELITIEEISVPYTDYRSNKLVSSRASDAMFEGVSSEPSLQSGKIEYSITMAATYEIK